MKQQSSRLNFLVVDRNSLSDLFCAYAFYFEAPEIRDEKIRNLPRDQLRARAEQGMMLVRQAVALCEEEGGEKPFVTFFCWSSSGDPSPRTAEGNTQPANGDTKAEQTYQLLARANLRMVDGLVHDLRNVAIRFRLPNMGLVRSSEARALSPSHNDTGSWSLHLHHPPRCLVGAERGLEGPRPSPPTSDGLTSPSTMQGVFERRSTLPAEFGPESITIHTWGEVHFLDLVVPERAPDYQQPHFRQGIRGDGMGAPRRRAHAQEPGTNLDVDAVALTPARRTGRARILFDFGAPEGGAT
ncbi:hypothetical protein PAPYR_1606 [Paratrimastix pyriformis]|uniref:Uncharacterized protein n=1 Tax=Paratrimastix pyriformis TaxID=342808 RepID=A0ABQ8URZ3_9EUKA|nr:hypothetical protein PAPYR_1606 [Paratrimastix pyriformis]